MATINKIDLNGDTYDIESSGLVTTQPTNPSEGATYYDTVNDVVKVYDGTSWNPISGGGGSVAYATSSTAGNVAEKEVSVPSITTLNVGQILCIKPTASATVANLTIKLNNFTAYPIRYNNGAITTTTDDVVWSQNFVSQFVFDGAYRQFVSHGYDNNTTYTQNILFDRGGFVSGSGTYAITRYSICLQKPDMTWEKVTNTGEAHSVNNDKTVNTHGFLLNGEMLYYSNTAVLANGAISSSNTMYKQYSGFDIRYSANTSGTGYTAGDYIYFVGTIGADGLFYLDATQWWDNALPSTNDGKVYVKVGKYVSGVTVTFEIDHPAYYHDGTRIREYKGINSTDVTTALGYTPVNPSTLGTAATKNTGTSSGNVPVLDSNGHLASSTIPGVALTDTFTVSTSSDLTTLSSADQGDIAIVSLENKTYVLSQAPYSTASNWKQILSPTGGVTSVNGQTGAVTVNEPKVSATAPSSPTEGMIWYDTTNDKLKTYNGSSWDEAGGGATYTAGEGIEIGGVQMNARKGPSPDGFHVPSVAEWEGLNTIMTSLSLTTGNKWKANLHMPFAGYRNAGNADITSQGSYGYYWSSSPYSTSNSAYYIHLYSSRVVANDFFNNGYGIPIRCFKDSYITPDSSWTVINGTLGSAGIFWNQSEGLISITDGTNGYTIMDKNLGATTVYNDGDTLSEANCGKYFQWGNNYGFPFSGNVTTSSTQVDTSAYGPTNPYSSDTFIIGSGAWSSVDNDDLWGDTTGTYTLENVITNTGVLSVNGQTGNIIVPEPTVISGDSGTTYTIKVSNSAPASGTPNTTITFVTGS